ncbi:hypothetical protein BS50DRAFT_677825 [Corynespora cassiicola Philippines]|uniref:Uncharacterized protein n=1 Tax=Corynespora cassiicola Philippines TaxID=1448308 RepID=A0A2T2NHN3_CORCC|nr:hypothetical protein BS50DRAFT_677825 [Corynespora cassiicola Philippines]
MPSGNNPMTTIALAFLVLVLSLPLSTIILIFESVSYPNVTLSSLPATPPQAENPSADATQAAETAPTRAATTYALESGPTTAVFAAAYISIVASALVAAGLVVLRHFSARKVVGWGVFGAAACAFAGVVVGMVYANVVQGRDSELDDAREVSFGEGVWRVGGRGFTEETWACMMDGLGVEGQRDWAGGVCSDLRTGRYMTIPLAAAAVFLLVLAYWQIRQLGGLSFLCGRQRRAKKSSERKVEEIAL